MSTDTDTSTQDGNKQTSDSTSDAGDTSKPDTITMTSKQLAERLERAKPGDYDDLKAKAARLDEIEAASKSDLEKATEQAAVAERDRDDARAEALRLRVAVEHGIGLEDADLFLTGRDEETLRQQAKRLSDRTAETKRNGNVVPGEGRRSTAAEGDDLAFARAIFGGD